MLLSLLLKGKPAWPRSHQLQLAKLEDTGGNRRRARHVARAVTSQTPIVIRTNSPTSASGDSINRSHRTPISEPGRDRDSPDGRRTGEIYGTPRMSDISDFLEK